MANKIEKKWQEFWDANETFITENPKFDQSGNATDSKQPFFVMDMFPYPSGAGLHVGHPLGYIATDVIARFERLRNKRVLHALGYDAFGLPAEQFAIQTGQHPRVTTENNINNMRSQLKKLGLAHDPSRTFSTIDPEYIRWTQWIFSKIYDSYYDEKKDCARPISELIEKFEKEKWWSELSDSEKSEKLNEFRLAYISTSVVNWCPGLGTVLANEEVTAEGKSERGNFPVFKKELKQWSMRITAFANRLDEDLKILDWPEKVKAMQHNWIGKSRGAYVDFEVTLENGEKQTLKVFTTRPDTIKGATFMVVAPEHELVKKAATKNKEGVDEYVKIAVNKSSVERQKDAGAKTGVNLGIFATNPVTKTKLPIFVADYVLIGYGTGAIMAVPADDERDSEFAKEYNVEIAKNYEKFESVDLAISALEKLGVAKESINFRLRDWLFSRQRYWGEPFPIVFDESEVPHLLPETALPVLLPDVPDYHPKTFGPNDENSTPEPPLGRNDDWVNVELDLGNGLKKYRRETNTMPNWAGSCWYYLRYLNASYNPPNDSKSPLVEKELDAYWLKNGVDLYVGGVEHAVLHLLYARFWHKVLFDLGFVSSKEPFHKLFNQGYIQAFAYTDSRGAYVEAEKVIEKNSKFYFVDGAEEFEVFQEYGKMGKSLKNVVTPDEMAEKFGADTFRIYEMSMGPLELSRPWETRAVIGAQRYLQRLWRLVINEENGEVVYDDSAPQEETLRELNKCTAGVQDDLENLRVNTAITKLIIYSNYLTTLLSKNGSVPKSAVEPLVILTAPFAPHIAEELWEKLGHSETVTFAKFPEIDEKFLSADSVKIGVQVNGKVRAELEMPTSASKEDWEKEALELTQIKSQLDGKQIKKAIVIPGKIVNFVV